MQVFTNNPTLDRALNAAIEAWKTKLLDLSKRNRLINFKVNKVSTVTIVDELPAEVFRHLYVEERPMKFLADDEHAPNEAAGIDGDEPWDADEAGTVEAASDMVLYEPGELHRHHTDDKLQTNLPQEKLDHSLRRMEEQARLVMEEQGVNTLFITLGMLHYKESATSEDIFRAPIVLLPVELTRRSARAAFELRVADDEPMVNPAAAERLRQLGIELPQLPEQIPDNYDLQVLLTAIGEAIRGQAGWRLTNDIFLCPLSFQKFVMYKDLQKHLAAIGNHRLIRELVGRTGTNIVGLPAEFRNMDLDTDFAPEKTFQVVDADSSQLRAMAAVQAGRDLVIEGPPGTGKSQTITNLIAQALAQGKTVLFVAEKMAALTVVHDRLRKANLSEFCLELHSSKTNKRDVMQNLANSFDASLKRISPDGDSSQQLASTRNTLSEYVRALHEPFGTLDITPFKGFGELGRVRNAPLHHLTRDIALIDQSALAAAIRDLEDLARAFSQILTPISEHPLRDSTRTFYADLELQQLRELSSEAVSAVSSVMTVGARVSETCGLPAIATSQDADVALKVAGVMAGSPGAPTEVLQSDLWNEPPPAAMRLIAAGKEARLLDARVKLWFSAEAFEQPHAPDIQYVEQKKSGFGGLFAFLDPRYRAIAKRWKSYRLAAYNKSLVEQAHDLKSVDTLLTRRAELQQQSGAAQQLFGALWKDENSDWDALGHYVEWVVRFRRVCVDHGLKEQAVAFVANARPDVSVAKELETAVKAMRDALRSLEDMVGWPSGYGEVSALGEMATRLQLLSDNPSMALAWGNFERLRVPVAAGIAAELLPHALNGSLPFDSLAPSFERSFYTKWLSGAVQVRPALATFLGLTHEQRIQEFQALDRKVLNENRQQLVQKLRTQTQDRVRQPDAAAGMPFLQREMMKQRAIAPLRRTMANASATVRAIKPCFLMSPITAAQLLDGSEPSFDLVIFDEASQLPPEDAIGSIIRGRQLVVVGDPKQLPPTNFFAIASGQVTAPVDESGNPLYDDSESILEQYMGAGIPMSRLKWHYRSAHESLITFSNVRFYDGELNTFPCTDHPCEGLAFVHVADSVYEGGGINRVEARAVADAVVLFATEQLTLPIERRLSLAVGTFNIRQQLAIQDELELRRRANGGLEEFFAHDAPEPFFVKNLENIQGDERDVIFLSVTFGRGVDGRVRNTFGALNSANGGRRLNVIASRARQHMRVYSSIHGEDVNPLNAMSPGPQLIKDFLTYAEHRRLDGPTVNAMAGAESPFEREVARELINRGYQVVPQVGAAGYRIDIGILDDQRPGRFLCAIECDGVAYHSAETARDRDRLREEVLRARGWSIHRVWSTDWFRDPKAQMERLTKLIEADRAASAQPTAPRTAASVQAAALPPQDSDSTTPATAVYTRPIAAPYRRADGAGKYVTSDLLQVSMPNVARELAAIVDVESPIHFMEAAARVAGLWSTRLGRRIQAHIDQAMIHAERIGAIRRKGDFLWSRSDRVELRSRAGMATPAERIPPDEIKQAILAVLAEGHFFSRDALATEVRAVLGFDRLGRQLESVIGYAIKDLLELDLLGEGAAGICLRDV